MKSNPFLSPLRLCAFACLCGIAIPGHAQTGISFGREIIYPTRFTVDAPQQVTQTGPGGGTTTTGVSTYPVVTPEDFTTRKLGTRNQITNVAVTGRVLVTKSADGAEVAVLRSSGGTEFQVKTGSLFKMNGQVFHAMGYDVERRYRVRNVANGQFYFFTAP